MPSTILLRLESVEWLLYMGDNGQSKVTWHHLKRIQIQHYNDVTMGAMASQITSLTIVYSTVLFRRKSKKTSKLRETGLCAGNSPVTGEFPAQKASDAENISIWWRHHGFEFEVNETTRWYPKISNSIPVFINIQLTQTHRNTKIYNDNSVNNTRLLWVKFAQMKIFQQIFNERGNQQNEHLIWWRHQMETFSALLVIWAGNSPVPGEFPWQRPVTWSFDVFFDLRLNKLLSKQS